MATSIDQALSDAVSRGLSTVRGEIGRVLGPVAGVFQLTERVVRDAYMTTRAIQAAASYPESIIPAAIGGTTTIGGLRFPSETGKYYFTMAFAGYQRPSLFDPVSLTTSDSIVLPIPANLQEVHKLNYSDGDLGVTLGTMAESGVQVGTLLGDVSIDSVTSQLPSSIQGALGGAGAAVDRIEQALKGALLNNTGDIGRVAGQIAGQTGNPFLTVFFKGPTLRTHDFSWRLSPKNADESRAIKDIVLAIKRHSLTKRVGEGILIGYPDIVELKLSPNDEYLYQFKPCVVESVSVNYAPSGVPSFYAGTGAPAEVELRVVFQEIEYFLSTDFGDDGIAPSNLLTDFVKRTMTSVQDSETTVTPDAPDGGQ